MKIYSTQIPFSKLTALLVLCFAFCAAQIAGAAGTTTWSGGGANQNWSTSGNWTTAGGSTPPGTGDAVIFGPTGSVSTQGTINNIVDSSFTAAIGSLTYSNNLSAKFHTTQIPAGNTLTVSGPIFVGITNDNYTFTGGGTLMGGTGTSTYTVETVGGGTITNDLSSLSNFVFNAGGAGGAFSVGPDVGNTCNAIMKLAAASNNITTTTLLIGNNNTGGSSTLNLGGGTNIINANTLEMGDNKVTGTMQFNSASGSLMLRNAAGTGRTTVLVSGTTGHSGSSSVAGVGNIFLNGHYVDMMIGTLTLGNRGGRSGSGGGGNGATGIFSFNNGIVDVTNIVMAVNSSGGTNSTSTLSVGGGTLKVGTGGISLVNNGGDAINVGTLIVTNGGTIICSNSIFKTTSAGTGNIGITNGTLTLTSSAGTVGTTAIPIDNFSISNATLHLNLNGSSILTSITANNVTVTGSNTVTIDSLVNVTASPTVFPLISYTGTDPTTNKMTLSALPGIGYTGNLVDDSADHLIKLSVTPPPVPDSVIWVGATNGVLSTNWNTTTTNWLDANLFIPTNYADLDIVTFDDTASNCTINLNQTVTPGSISFNNINSNYVVGGAGLITGVTGLTNLNTGTVLLKETGGDNFGGGITLNSSGTIILDNPNSSISGGLNIISGGTVQIGNNDTNGFVPAGTVTDNGALIFTRTNSLLVTNSISGTGTLTQNGKNGTLTLNNTNNYSGNTIVSKGTLALAGAGTISGSPSLLVSNATFDVSGVPGTATLLNDFNVTNAAINVGSTNLQPSISTTTFEADGITSNSNIVNVVSLPPIASYPVTLTLIQSASTISLANGNFNFALGSLPASSPTFAGSLSESVDSKSILLTLTSGSTNVRPSVLWVGTNNVSATTNWSDRLNWQLPGAPVAAENVIFNNNGVVAAGSVNNFVDQNFTIASLSYTNLGTGNYHVTDIPADSTLTVSNNLTVGGLTADGAVSDVAFTDGGTLVANGSSLTIGNNGVTGADTGTILDLSGLSNFVYNSSSGTITMGIGSRSAANFKLAGFSNNITAGTWNANTASSSSSDNGTLTLGAGTNILNIGTINIAAERSSSTVQFPATGGLRLRGTGGNDTSRATVVLGNRNAGGTGPATTTGTLSLNSNPVDMKISTLTVGQCNQGATITGSGTLQFDTGIIDATSIKMAVNSGAGSATGAITVGASGILVVGSGGISLVNQTSTGAGTGTLTISGGTVICSNSIVKTTNAGTSTGNISLTDGTLNMVAGTIGTLAIPIDALNLSDNGTLDTKIQLNVTQGVTNIVASAITTNGITTINIGSITGLTSSNQIPIIKYGGSDPYGNLSIGTLPAGYTATLYDDVGNSSIDLDIVPPPLLDWVGAVASLLNSNWDMSTLDWQNSGTPSAYADGYPVQFDDTASNSTVTLLPTVLPNSIDVTNNILNYTFNGTGKISGLTSLIKQGSKTLTMNESGGDNFSGGITVSNGTLNLAITGANISGGLTNYGTLNDTHTGTIAGGLTVNSGSALLDQAGTISGNTVNAAGATIQVGNNDTNGSLPSGGVTNNGSLVFNQNTNVTVANVISGTATGMLTQNGSNILTLSGANTFTGAVVVASGTLLPGSGTALGVTNVSITVSNGATLDDGGQNLSAYPNITVSGSGVNGNGAIVNSGANQTAAFGHLTLAGNTTFGGNSRWDLRLTGGSLLTGGNPYSITKVGTNQVTLVHAITIDQALSNIVVQSGIFGVQEIGAFNGLGTNGSVTVFSNATFEVDFGETLTNVTKPIIFLDGSTLLCENGANNIDDPVTLSTNAAGGPGNCIFNIITNSMTLSNVVSGPGNLITIGSSNLLLTATNTYTGSTTISNGLLMLVNNGSIADSTNITVASGATLNVSGRTDGTLTLVSGQTLFDNGTVTCGSGADSVTANSGATVFGNGTISGYLLPDTGSTVSPGSGSGAIGTLTVNGTASLAGTTLMKINTSLSPSNDVFKAGTLSYGGTLTVTNLGPALVAGESFTLFSTSLSFNSFSTTNLPVLSAGLVWTNSGVTWSVLSVGAPPSTVSNLWITHFSLSGGTNLVIDGTNLGMGTYYVLASTNVAQHLTNWTAIATNTLSGSGSFTNIFTNAVNTSGLKQQFYILSTTNN